MIESILRKYIVKIIIVGFLLYLLPVVALSTEHTKRPEWVLDTIILPEKKNTEINGFALYKDKKGKIVYNYDTPKKLHNKKVFDFSTHQEINPNTLELFLKPKTNDFLDGLEMVSSEFSLGRVAMPHTLYETEIQGDPSKCNPIGPWLDFFLRDKIESYMFLLSFEDKFSFKSDDQCSWMNGKQKIKIHNLGVYPLIWVVDEDRLLLGSYDKAFFIVINIKKIDLAFKKDKTVLFDVNGVKGYWVKESIVDECINKVLEKLFTQYGWDIYSGNPLKGNMSINEYIDQEITKELNKLD
jgi:hypothetical protein